MSDTTQSLSDRDRAGLFLDALSRWDALTRSWKGKTPRAIAEYEPSDRHRDAWKQMRTECATEAREVLKQIKEHGEVVVKLTAKQGDHERAKLLLDWIDAQDKWEYDRWTVQFYEEVRSTVNYLRAIFPTARSTTMPPTPQKMKAPVKDKQFASVIAANAAMEKAIEEDPDRMKWSVRKWQHYLRGKWPTISLSTIYGTALWEQAKIARAAAKQERMQRNRGKRKTRHRPKY